MEITKQKQSGFTVVNLNGRLDTTNYGSLDKELETIVNAGEKNILINCSEMNYISSSGLRVFLIYLKKLKAEQGKLILCNMQPTIKEVFSIAGFTSLFSIYDSLEEALNS
jgi:anti-anti-sigma factor